MLDALEQTNLLHSIAAEAATAFCGSNGPWTSKLHPNHLRSLLLPPQPYASPPLLIPKLLPFADPPLPFAYLVVDSLTLPISHYIKPHISDTHFQLQPPRLCTPHLTLTTKHTRPTSFTMGVQKTIITPGNASLSVKKGDEIHLEYTGNAALSY